MAERFDPFKPRDWSRDYDPTSREIVRWGFETLRNLRTANPEWSKARLLNEAFLRFDRDYPEEAIQTPDPDPLRHVQPSCVLTGKVLEMRMRPLSEKRETELQVIELMGIDYESRPVSGILFLGTCVELVAHQRYPVLKYSPLESLHESVDRAIREHHSYKELQAITAPKDSGSGCLGMIALGITLFFFLF